jgi:hypothetical protein
LPGSLVRRTGETSSSVASGAAGPAGQLFEVGRSQPDYARRIAEALERIAAALEGGVPAAVEPGTPLPEGFPGRRALHEAGVVYLERVPRTGPGLAALGLDGVTVNRILTQLKSEA